MKLLCSLEYLLVLLQDLQEAGNGVLYMSFLVMVTLFCSVNKRWDIPSHHALLLRQGSISRSDLLNNLSMLVCSLKSSWQSMYPQAKPNKLISQSPLYTLPPAKKLMAGTYNPSQNNHRDANCISL